MTILNTLTDLAQQLDRLDPETAWKERVEIAEQMKALLGDRQAEFERGYDALLAPVRIELTGRKADHVTLNIPGGDIHEIVLTSDDPKAIIWLTSLYHGAWNLLQRPDETNPGQVLHRNGVSVPGRLPLQHEVQREGKGCLFSSGVPTTLTFQADRKTSVGVLFVRKNPAETALRILAVTDAFAAAVGPAAAKPAPADADDTEAIPRPSRERLSKELAELMAMGQPAHRSSLALDLTNDHTGQKERHLIGLVTTPDAVPRIVACYQPGQAGPACLNEIERAPALAEGKAPRLTKTSVLTLDTEQLATLHEAGHVRHGNAWITLIQKREGAEGPASAEAAPPPPLSDEDRVAAATAAYRTWRTLARQAQVAESELAGASAAWTAARDSFERSSPGAVKLEQATTRIDQEIAEAKRRPPQFPNQLPGAIRRR